MKAAVDKAIRMPAEEPKVRNLNLNQRVAPVASLIARAEWMACAGDADLEDGEEISSSPRFGVGERPWLHCWL